MAEMTLSLFTDERGQPIAGCEEAARIKQEHDARKRGTYNKTPKVEPISPYLELQQIQLRLGAFMPKNTPLLLEQSEDAVFCCADNKINVYYEVYDGQSYEYEGETYTDEPEKMMLVDLASTENFYITDRIALHKELLEILEQGVELNKAVSIMQPKIAALQQPKIELDRRLIG